MISQAVMYGLLFQFLVCFLVPIILIVYLKKKNLLSWKSLGVGVIIFLLFVNILERLLHSIVINPENPTTLVFSDNPFFYVLYGILAAALFEEFGRFVGYKFLLKDKHKLGDGLSYGLGHGGVEMFTIGILGAVTGFMMIGLINSGELASTLGSQMTPEQITTLEDQFKNTPYYFYVLSGLERLAALGMQIFLSLVVLLGVRKGDMTYVWVAVIMHAIFNTAPALYQIGVIRNVFIAEIIIFLFGILALYGMKKLIPQLMEKSI